MLLLQIIHISLEKMVDSNSKTCNLCCSRRAVLKYQQNGARGHTQSERLLQFPKNIPI